MTTGRFRDQVDILSTCMDNPGDRLRRQQWNETVKVCES